jgi:alpha-tubulin suppressor-like RCC1 family protein
MRARAAVGGTFRNLAVLTAAASLVAFGCTALLGDFDTNESGEGTPDGGDASTRPDIDGSPPDGSVPPPPPDANPCTETPCVVAIATGLLHTCALTEGGQIACWGDNSSGAIGTGRIADGGGFDPPLVATPRSVGAPGATAITAGGILSIAGVFPFSCELREGRVACWGSNVTFQLGRDVEGGFDPNPAPVEGLSNVRLVRAGGAHACAVQTSGRLSCWGFGGSGQLGRPLPEGTASDKSPSTVALPADEEAVDVVGGLEHTCALMRDGDVYCWGRPNEGQLGRGVPDASGSAQPAPQKVLGLAPSKQIAAGRNTTCALTEAGRVFCFGEGEPNGGPRERLFPGGLVMKQLALGYDYACALATNGSVWCWGDNGSGQTGQGALRDGGSIEPRFVEAPTSPVEGLPNDIVAVAAGGGHSCALAASGGVYCWGSNGVAQLGDGWSADPTTKTQLSIRAVKVKF